MNTLGIKEAADLLRNCSYFANQPFDQLIVSQLGGWSNTSFKFDFGREAFAVRINRENPFLEMDRNAEKINSQIGETLEIGAKIEYSEDRLQIAKFIDHEGVANREDLVSIVEVLKKLHTSGKKFSNDLNPYERLVKVCGKLPLDPELALTIKSLKKIYQSKIFTDIAKVPCHNDTTTFNMLKTAKGIQLIDWEHSANNDPAWDLAYLSTEADFTESEDRKMIDLYSPENLPEFFLRFINYKILCHLWISVWIQTQIASNNKVVSEEEFRNIAKKRLEKAKGLLKQREFMKPHILLTNDDSIAAPGLFSLWRALKDHAEITIAAPLQEQSGSGLAITTKRPLHVKEVPWPEGTKAYSVDGTPADCVRLAVRVLLPRAPDLVVSGINRGANSGRNLLYSGTVAAVIEATMQGLQGIAFSCDNFYAPNFKRAESWIYPLVQYVLAHPFDSGTFLNVTFPDQPGPIQGVRMAMQGHSYWREAPQECRHPEGDQHYWLGGKWFESDYEHEESDISLIKKGYLTAVPIQVQQLTDQKEFTQRKAAFNSTFTFLSEEISV
jgi:5'-nucleotidase